MHREIGPELLDDLPATDPRAVGSRADLRWLNRLMGHAGIIANALPRELGETGIQAGPLRVIELGAGDGTLLLRLAREWAARGVRGQVTLVDRHGLVAADTRCAFTAMEWTVESVVADVFDWMGRQTSSADVVIANLFLHHFRDEAVAGLFRMIAARSIALIACEPRRSSFALAAARMLWLAGCNDVTRHDAVRSVRAGFRGSELSALWPKEPGWKTTERPAGLFSHCFSASNHG